MIIFCIALLSSQSMMAKKLVYLGHNYDGKVKNKVPEGEGEIFVGNLKILGTFSANTVTNASVSWYDQTIPNVMFLGTVIFDESNDITLKAGGMFKTFYFPNKYDHRIDDRKSFDETLAEDRITSSLSVDSLFNPKTLKIPYTHSEKNNDNADLNYNLNYNGFNIPNYLTVKEYKYVRLEDIECPIDQWGRYKVKTKAFIYEKPYWDVKKPIIMKDFKDNEGRTWNINYDVYNHESTWTVSYPGGSWYTKNAMDLNNSFELHYSDGAVVKTTKKYWYYLIFDDGIWISTSSMKKDFIQNVKQNQFSIPEYENGYRYIYSADINFETFSEQDVKKFIEEKILPRFKRKEGVIEFCLVKDADDTQKNIVAWYKDGKTTLTKKQQAQANESVRKEYSENVARLKKAYGAKYVDAAMKGNLLVGMPLDLLSETKFWYDYTNNYKLQPYMSYYAWSVFKHNTTLGVYRIQRQHKTTGKLAHFKVWVRNGKITEIYND